MPDAYGANLSWQPTMAKMQFVSPVLAAQPSASFANRQAHLLLSPAVFYTRLHSL